MPEGYMDSKEKDEIVDRINMVIRRLWALGQDNVVGSREVPEMQDGIREIRWDLVQLKTGIEREELQCQQATKKCGTNSSKKG